MTERFLTIEQRARRRLGWLLATGGILVPAALVGAAINATYVNVPAVAVIVLVGVIAAAFGVRLASEARTFVEVNPTARTCVITERGVRGQVQPLESLAPLTVSLTSSAPRRNPYSSPPRDDLSMAHSITTRPYGRSQTFMYEIHPAGRSDLGLFEFRTADQARRKLEALAASWGISSRAYGGEVRKAETLDIPLHQRIATDASHSSPIAFDPNWGLTVEPLAPGYVFTFTRPSPFRFVLSGAYFFGALVVLVVLYSLGILDAEMTSLSDDISPVIAIGLVPFLVLFSARGVIGLLAARPRPLRVTPEGVTLGRTTLPFDQIEEVTWVLDVTVRGDRRKLRIPGSWFPAEAGPILVREIKRAIAETAPLATQRGTH